VIWAWFWLACAPAPEDADHDGLSPPEDCDDRDPRVGLGPEWLGDADSDGFPDPERVVRACAAPDGFVGPEGACPAPPRGPHTCPADCRDDDASMHPGAAEICDGRDQDCDGLDDDDAIDAPSWYEDADGDGHAGTFAARDCEAPAGAAATELTDCDDADPTAFPGGTETCDYVDDDCDGVVDEGLPVATWWRDADRDGFGDAALPLVTCGEPLGYVQDDADCDDADRTEFPGAVWHADADGDGFGDPALPRESCERPAAHVSDATDCDDADPDEHPGAVWAPDADGDGHGSTADAAPSCARPEPGWIADASDCDDGDATRWELLARYEDADGDGWGDALYTLCGEQPGFVTTDGDCDDGDDEIWPGAAELCNDEDDDCDGVWDEDATGWYDADGDGYGDPATQRVGYCATGWVGEGTDCDDAEDNAFPGAIEWCNGRDDDCDGLVDGDDPDEAGDATWYADADGDGFGDDSLAVSSCEPPSGYAEEGGDCDLADGSVSPGAEEACFDEIDDDCDGSTACPPGVPVLTGERRDDGSHSLYHAALAALGDVDGDGYDDLVVGTWWSDLASDAGAAWYVRGPLFEERLLSDAAVRIDGAPYEYAGWTVASAGDMDGDGATDLAVGAPGIAPFGPGDVWLLAGPAGATSTSSAGFARIRGQTGAAAGESISRAGDVDGDGWDDLLVGMPGYDYDRKALGAVAVAFGPASGTLAWDEDAVLVGLEHREFLGGNVLGGHDLDGDGVPDVVAAGLEGVVVESGERLRTRWVTLKRESEAVWEGGSEERPARLAAGDFDGDGTDDLAIGRPWDDDVWIATDPFAGGSAATHELTGSSDPWTTGYEVAVLPDVDGDGISEVLVSDPGAQEYGAIYLVRQPASGTTDLSDADRIWRGTPSVDPIGTRLVVGDFDGDGRSDLLHGAVADGQYWGGALFLISGADL
jgi:hypothetical protein